MYHTVHNWFIGPIYPIYSTGQTTHRYAPHNPPCRGITRVSSSNQGFCSSSSSCASAGCIVSHSRWRGWLSLFFSVYRVKAERPISQHEYIYICFAVRLCVVCCIESAELRTVYRHHQLFTDHMWVGYYTTNRRLHVRVSVYRSRSPTAHIPRGQCVEQQSHHFWLQVWPSFFDAMSGMTSDGSVRPVDVHVPIIMVDTTRRTVSTTTTMNDPIIYIL